VFERFTERARQVVVRAQEEARVLGHDHIGTEHLLLGVLREESGIGARVLTDMGVTIEAVRGRVLELVESNGPAGGEQIPFTADGKKALELALREALSFGHNYIGTEHLLLGLTAVDDGLATGILRECGVDGERIRAAVVGLIAGTEPDPSGPRRPAMAARVAALRARHRVHVDPSPEVRRLLMRAAACALEDGRDEMRLDDVLIALTRDPASAELLASLDIDETSVRSALSRRQASEDPPAA
jgi:ATP-dependent Clp protease ATP-binding subunit ClpC